MGINTIEDLFNAKLPAEVIRDIDKRITDWLAVGGGEDDPYIKQQFRYAENYLKMTRRNDLLIK
ncbi:DUF6877 family protein [Clostridium saudiense]|uniref:DUF6877 family protein n=1 Tax=Clostridium saudiense TaxID=1414720 RepID=UPI00267024B6|nr:DUF6877 family protein [Clostridium saudiense]